MRGVTYCYGDFNTIDADALNEREDRLISLNENLKSLHCVKDIPSTKRAGLKRLLAMLEAEEFDILIIDKLQSLGTGEVRDRLLQLLADKQILIRTPDGEEFVKVKKKRQL